LKSKHASDVLRLSRELSKARDELDAEKRRGREPANVSALRADNARLTAEIDRLKREADAQ
ncbi:MAG: hypothetical protein R3268_14600, partial [Acidiferrobacterales bacterium]|nr:hypothetical protein [Acidiferrobacterales bacterium]